MKRVKADFLKGERVCLNFIYSQTFNCDMVSILPRKYRQIEESLDFGAYFAEGHLTDIITDFKNSK